MEGCLLMKVTSMDFIDKKGGNFSSKSRSTYITYYLSMVIFIFLGILLPILVTGRFIPEESTILIFTLIVIYMAIRLAIIGFSNKRRILEMNFYIFAYIFMGIVPLAQIKENSFYWPGNYSNSDFILSGIIIFIGCIAYDIGIILDRKSMKELQQSPTLTFNYKNIKRLSLIAVLLTLVSIAVLGGPNILFSTRAQVAGALDQSSALIFTGLLRVPIFLALVFCLVYFINRKSKKFILKSNVGWLFLILILSIGNLLVSNPVSTARFWFGTIVITVMLLLIKWNSKTVSKLILGIIFILLVIFPYSDVFRHGTSINIEAGDFNSNVVNNGDFDAFQQLMNTTKYTETYGFSFGGQLVGTPLFWLPRDIWKSKPSGTGQIVAESSGYDYTNLSAPLWAEFYVDFGFFGVILFFLIYGWLSSRLQRKYLIDILSKNSTFFTVFVPIFSAYQFFLLRGQLLSTFPFLALLLVFTVMAIKLNQNNKIDTE